MWRRSWVINEHFLNFLVGGFIFTHECIIAKEDLVVIYLFSYIILFLLLFLFFVIYLFLLSDLLFITLLVTVRAFLPVLIIAVTFFNRVSILFLVYTVLVLFYLRTIYTLVPIFPQLYHFPLIVRTYNTFYGSFPSLWLYHASILSYLADILSRILSVVNISMSASNYYSRFSMVFSYYSGMLGSMWVIISTSSIITPNFCKLPLNNSSSSIQSSGSLLTSSNSHFDIFLCSLVLDAPDIGWNSLFNFPHARKVHPLGNSLVTNSSTIWKHTVLGLPGGYICGLPLPFYRVTTTNVPRIRTQVPPTTYH